MTIPKHQLHNPTPLVDKGDAVPRLITWVTYITGAQSGIHRLLAYAAGMERSVPPTRYLIPFSSGSLDLVYS